MPQIEVMSPKMLREAATQLEHALRSGQYVPGAMKTESMANQMRQLIEAIDKVRPVGVDGKHGDRHTANCGCEDKGDMHFCKNCGAEIVLGSTYLHMKSGWFHVSNRLMDCPENHVAEPA